MKQLPEFYIDYIAVGKRNIVEQRLYTNCPFVVNYETLDKQRIGQNVGIKILSDQKYELELDGKHSKTDTLEFGQRFNKMGFDFTINLRDQKGFVFNPDISNKYYFTFLSPESLASIYRGKLSVNPVMEDASLVTLGTTGTVFMQEIDYLNKLMSVYLDYGLSNKNETAKKSIEFIENQLGVISDSLRIAESALESFKQDNGFLDLSSEGTLVQSKLEKIDVEKSELLIQKRYYEYLKNYIRSKTETEDIIAPSVMGVTDQTLTGLVTELTKFQLQKKTASNESGCFS